MHQRPFHPAHKVCTGVPTSTNSTAYTWLNPYPSIQVQDPNFVSAVTRRTPNELLRNPKESDPALGNPAKPIANDFFKSPDTLEL